MVNITISIPENLKTEMEFFVDVNWSEVCRRAIAREIQLRKSPVPQVEFILQDIKPQARLRGTGNPGLLITVQIFNKMSFGIVVDRILCYARFDTDPVGFAAYLHREEISANSSKGIYIPVDMTERRIIEVDQGISSTFICDVEYEVFVEGYDRSSSGLRGTRIPIDEWKSMVSNIKDRKGPRSSISRCRINRESQG